MSVGSSHPCDEAGLCRRGAECNASAGGPWGTWVEPSTSARSVIGEKQYEADTSSLVGGARNTQRRIKAGEAAMAAAVAKSDRSGLGLRREGDGDDAPSIVGDGCPAPIEGCPGSPGSPTLHASVPSATPASSAVTEAWTRAVSGGH